MLRHVLVLALSLGLAGAACYTEEEYAYPSANLAYVSPGVEVVAGYDYPVFYSDGYYWRWSNNGWYRSARWDRGWAYSAHVPEHVRGVAHPWTYSHYHPAPGVAMRPAHVSGGHHR